MPYVTIEEEVWVDLEEFETEDLVEELKKRKGVSPSSYANDISGRELVDEIYMAKHVRQQPYDHLIDQLIYAVTGRVL